MSPFTFARPALFALDPERAHRLTIAALKAMPRRTMRHDPCLTSIVAGVAFASPVGLAAGFDKDAEVPYAMLTLGFGSVEVGTLTPRAQAGNPKPRLFRLVEDQGVVNRMGFNNGGHAAARMRLAERRGGAIVGVNIGANKDSVDRIADYVAGILTMGPVADYLCVNISSPNTPGLRDLQAGGELVDLLTAIREVRSPGGPPVWLKVAPDLDDADVARIVATSIAHGIDAIVIGNTTVSRPMLRSRHASETGGLSGMPLAALALDRLHAFARESGGRIPLVAAGGIDSAAAAYARLRAGASLVQLYSALVYLGPGIARAINDGLVALMRRDGVTSIAALVGVDAPRISA